jgi:uncharacterized phage protein (TIGR01671 family)
MKREIKFRAWDGAQMHWLDFLWNHHWYNSEKGGQASMDNSNKRCQADYQGGRLIVMQFTGLYDVNKNPIYEGDILKYNFEDETHDYMPVFFKDGAFMTGIKDNEYLSEDLDPVHDFRIEVVGNIYQNPELLTL